MTAHPEGRFTRQQQTVYLARPTKKRLDALKARLEQDKERQVTSTELIDLLLDRWDVMEQMTREASR